jgi:hypothetical protein
MQILVMQENKVYIFILLILCGCGSKELTPEEYVKWIDNKSNGMIKQETIGKVKYTVVYRPSDYQKAKAYISDDTFGLKHSKSDNHSFIVRMEPVDGKTQVLTIDASDKEEPFQRINYYLSEAPKHMQLLEGNDTMGVESYLFERYYNVSPAQNLVAGFHRGADLGESDLSFILEDKVLNTGKIYFNFSKSALKNIPKLINYEY